MRVSRLLAATAFLLPTFAAAQVPADLREAIRARELAAGRADTAAWSRVVSDDFVITMVNGSTENKAQRLARIARRAAQDSPVASEETIRRVGNVYARSARYGIGRATEIWAREPRGWRLQLVQITRIQPDVAAPVRQLIAAVDSGRFERIPEFLAPGFELHILGVPQPILADALVPAIREFYAAFPDNVHVIDQVLVDRDLVALRITQTATHKGAYAGVASTGKRVTIPGMAIMRMENGKIREWWLLEDNLGLMQQLGLELRAKTP